MNVELIVASAVFGFAFIYGIFAVAVPLYRLWKRQPRPGTLWRHRKGGLYVVLANDGLNVFYVTTALDTVTLTTLWRRPLDEFMDGRFDYWGKGKFGEVGARG